MERCALLAKDRSLFCQAKDQRQKNCLVGPALLLGQCAFKVSHPRHSAKFMFSSVNVKADGIASQICFWGLTL
jgi:hypothetical protein